MVLESKCMGTKEGERDGMSWETGIEIYTVVFIQ